MARNEVERDDEMPASGSLMATVRRKVRNAPVKLSQIGVHDLGFPPAWFGYRTVPSISLRSEVARNGGEVRVLHPEGVAHNPLPRNALTTDLPAERGWWGYSFRDVPTRRLGPTLRACLRDCRIVPFVDPGNGEFYVCVLTRNDRVLDVREMAFRPRRHPPILRRMRPRPVKRATWILERVYHNHSHWLTAHLPKVLLARDGDLLSSTILPGGKTTETIESSLRMMGVPVRDSPRLDPVEPLRVEELTLFQTDRFRPELLRTARGAFGQWISGSRSRRLYVSRDRASRRRLVNEDDVWSRLRALGFERIFMEELSFQDQVRAMGEADAVAAPHGAGLTNVMFCPPGTPVLEIADLSFPNPNFYAVASAMGHPYWIVPGQTRGTGHPLERDIWADPDRVAEAAQKM
jgi:hypothetical protein